MGSVRRREWTRNVSWAGGRSLSRAEDDDATGAGESVDFDGSAAAIPAFSFFLCFSEFRWASYTVCFE